MGVGADKKGIGADARQLLKIFNDLEPKELRAALDELAGIRFVHVNEAIVQPIPGIPPEFRGIVGVSVTESLQEYFDELGM